MAGDPNCRGYRNDPYDRGGTGGSGSAPDPLTELARLIGQSDPFATDRNRQPAPRQAEHPQSGDWRDDPNQQAQHYDHGAHDDRYAGTGEPQHDTGQGYGSEQAYQNNGYPYPQAGQHDARYDDAAGYAEHQYHPEPEAYHPDQHPYHQDQPAYPPSAQPHYAAEPAEQGEYDEQQADAQGNYPAPSFFGDPNSRPDDYYDDEPAPRRGWLVTAA